MPATPAPAAKKHSLFLATLIYASREVAFRPTAGHFHAPPGHVRQVWELAKTTAQYHLVHGHAARKLGLIRHLTKRLK